MDNSSSTSSFRALGARGIGVAALCVLVLVLFRLGARQALTEIYGPNTATQIHFAFREVERQSRFDCVLLGSSRIFRGVDPQRMPGRSFNFAHDGDGWNHAFYKLSYLLEHQRLPLRVVAGLDYFAFSTIDPSRRELYQPFFPEQFGLDYDAVAPRGRHWGETTNTQANLWWEQNFAQTLPLLLKGSVARPGALRRTLSSTGQLLVPDGDGPYRPDPFQPLAHRSVQPMTEMMRSYFERVLDLCRANGVHLTLVMLPTTAVDRVTYSTLERAQFWDYVRGRCGSEVQVLSFDEDRSFTLDDFSDDLHLNLRGAQRFSAELSKRLRESP